MRPMFHRLPRLLPAIVLLLGMLARSPALADDRPDIYSFTPAQRADLFTQMSNYITSAVILEHLDPPGDKHGSARFLVWHRKYIKDMEDYLISQNRPQYVPLPKWDPSTAIPAEFLAGGGVDADCPAAVHLAHNCNNLIDSTPNVPLPASLAGNLCTQVVFNNFRTTLESGYHNGVHVAVGGAMGAFKSPAAPIFWLWHAFVDDVWFDWQCECGLDEGSAFDTYTAGEQITNLQPGIADAWMRDSDDDIANEPNTETGSVLWQSKDIWVRNSQATAVGSTRFLNEHQHQNPEYSNIPADRPYIYAKVRNRGCETLSGNLHVYWANASMGLTWPADFTEVATSPVALSNIGPGKEHVGEFHWTNIPMPGGGAGDHFCLVARFVASPAGDDPINGEVNGVNVGQNVRNSNQIAWKNLTIVDNEANFAVFLRNILPQGDRLSLRFTVPPEQQNDSFFRHGRMTIDLGEQLFARWLELGGMGEGIEVDPRGFIQVFGDGATIEDIPVPPRAEFLINARFDLDEPPCADDVTAYEVRATSFNGRTILGGNTYLVRPREIRPSPAVLVVPVDPQIRCRTGEGVGLRSVVNLPPGIDIVMHQWFLDGNPIPNAQGAGHIATTSGMYSVLVSYSNGCDRMSIPVPVEIGTPPSNDMPCRAVILGLNQPVPYSIFCATADKDEVTPGVGSGPIGGCFSRDGWCERDPEVQNSVWFRFRAPTTGAVSIHTGHHDHVNAQLAVYEVGRCDDYGTYRLVAANDDILTRGVWGTDPALENLRVVPGREYYIQLDGFQGWRGEGTLVAEAVEPPCDCDWNADGRLNSQDFFDFLSSFFDGSADFNADGTTNSQDFFDFLTCFFLGCT